MSRDLTAAVIAAATNPNVRPAFFAFLDLDSGPVRVWTGYGNFVLDGDTYAGVGTFGNISPISESTGVRANGIELSLSGIPAEVVSLVLSEPYRGRPVSLKMAVLDASLAVIADAVEVFAGRIDTMSLNDSGETSVVTIAAESRLIDLERPRETRYTDEEQQRLFPGDLGLEYVAGLQDKELPWGVAAAVNYAPLPSGPQDETTTDVL